jgi:hypothetical protein
LRLRPTPLRRQIIVSGNANERVGLQRYPWKDNDRSQINHIELLANADAAVWIFVCSLKDPGRIRARGLWHYGDQDGKRATVPSYGLAM